MPTFNYSARDRAGRSVSNVLEAPSRRDAMRLLSARGLQVSGLTEQSGARAKAAPAKAGARSARPAAPGRFTFRRRGSAVPPTKKDRLPFFEALGDLMGSGLSAGESVRLLSQRIKDPSMKALTAGLWERLSEGATLSRAMGQFPEVFDPSTINLIQAGEATGSVSETVNRLIAHLTEQKELKRQMLSEMAYPAFMIVVSTGVVVFFLTFLMPKLQVMLRGLGGQMPASTRLMVAMSDFIKMYGIFVGIGIAVGLILFWQWRGTDQGRATTDRWVLRIPLFAEFSVARSVLSFSQTLGVLLENGINASEALRMTERQIANHHHRNALNKATDRVLEGEALSLALQRTGFFPDLVLDRLAVGENTGNVVPSLKEIAKSYQKVITTQMKSLVRVINSVVLTLVFAFIGFIAFAIVAAVFSLTTSFQR